MKVLLAVSLDSDPQSVSRYVARRFENKNIYIDILTVIPRKALGRGESELQLRQKAARLTNFISKILREQHNICGSFCHIETGEPSHLILQLSKRWRSSLILIQAPKNQGMLTALRRDGVSNQLFKKAQCSLELLRPGTNTENGMLKVLLPVNEDDIDSFPIQKLKELISMNNAQIRLVTAIPSPIDLSKTEVSPAVLLNEKRSLIARKAVLEGKLSALCNRVADALEHFPDIDFSISEGDFRDVICEMAERTSPSLIVMRDSSNINPIRKLVSVPSPTSFAVAAGYSVLLLRNNEDEANLTGKLRRVFNPALQEA